MRSRKVQVFINIWNKFRTLKMRKYEYFYRSKWKLATMKPQFGTLNLNRRLYIMTSSWKLKAEHLYTIFVLQLKTSII